MSGGDTALSGWQGEALGNPGMDNQSSGTAKRIEIYENGIGLINGWNRAAGMSANWQVSWSNPYWQATAGSLAKCISRSTGGANVHCYAVR